MISIQYDNGLYNNGVLPIRRQNVIWINDHILSIKPSGTHFIEILFEIQKFLFKEIHSKTLSAKLWAFCFGLNVLRNV